MSNNPFDRNKTKEAKLGELITQLGDQNQRDAVHIAVVPVEAWNNLVPGQHVGVTPDGKTAGTPGGLFSEAVGIVDPFLPDGVKSGETFWLFLYQGRVTTLRHEWTHPAFPPATQQGRDDKELSKSWLRQYAARTSPYEQADEAYERLLERLKDKQVHYNGKGMHSRDDLEDEAELKHHAEIVLGIEIDFGDENFSFTCGC